MDPSLAISALGNVVELTCTTLGGPGNTFSWTFEGVEVGNTSVISVNITAASDGGKYVCEVRNAAGNDSNTSEITGELYLVLYIGQPLQFL